MAIVRDPAFWKRFSMAVHLDEENSGSKPELKHSDSWLARQNAKRARRGWFCWAFWICFLAFIAAVVAVVIWLVQSGTLSKIKIGGGSGSPSQSANPNSNVQGAGRMGAPDTGGQ